MHAASAWPGACSIPRQVKQKNASRPLRGALSGALVVWMALHAPASAQFEDDAGARRPPGVLAVAFEAEVDGSEAVFRWRFEDVGETVIVCTLDPDGDGIFEYSVPDCENTEQLSHLYEDPGVYWASLVARTRDGRSGQATIRLEVR